MESRKDTKETKTQSADWREAGLKGHASYNPNYMALRERQEEGEQKLPETQDGGRGGERSRWSMVGFQGGDTILCEAKGWTHYHAFVQTCNTRNEILVWTMDQSEIRRKCVYVWGAGNESTWKNVIGCRPPASFSVYLSLYSARLYC